MIFSPFYSEHTRSRIVAGHTQEATPEETVRSIEAILSKSPEKRRHRKTHGRISFGDLARTIADKWKTLEAKDKAIFDHYAEIDMLRYRREVKVWKEKKDREEDEKAAYNVQQKQAAFMKSMGNSSFSSLDGSHSSAHSLLESLPYEGSTGSEPQPRKTTSQYDSFNSSYSSVESYGSESSHDYSAGSGMRMPMMMKQRQHLQQLQQKQQQQMQQAQLQRHQSAGSVASDMSSDAAMRASMLMQQQQQQQQQIQMQMQKHQEHLRQLQQQHQQLQQQQQELQQQQQGLTTMGGMQQTPQFVQSNQTSFGGGMMGNNNTAMMNNSMSFSNLMGNSSVVSLQSGSHHHDPLLGPSTGTNFNMMQQQQFQQQQQQQQHHMIAGSTHSGHGSSSTSAYSSFNSSANTGMHSSNSSLYDQQGQPTGLVGVGGMMGMNHPHAAAAASAAGMPGSASMGGGFNPSLTEGMPPHRAAFFDGSDHQPRGSNNRGNNLLLDDNGTDLEHYMGNMDLSRRNSGM